MSIRVVILSRWPEPGRCKTRLIPAVGADGAAQIHRRLTEKTVSTVRQSGLPFELWGTGASRNHFTEWLGPLSFRDQPEGDLGARLKEAGPPYPTIFLGTDVPDLAEEHLRRAADSLREHEAVIGPAADGGYWLLGLAQSYPSLFADMPWGTDQVYSLTRSRMSDVGIDPIVLPTLYDVDRPEDLDRWPGLRRP